MNDNELLVFPPMPDGFNIIVPAQEYIHMDAPQRWDENVSFWTAVVLLASIDLADTGPYGRGASFALQNNNLK